MEHTELQPLVQLDDSPLGLEAFSDPLQEDRADEDSHLASGLRGEAIRANVKALLQFGGIVFTLFSSNFILSSLFIVYEHVFQRWRTSRCSCWLTSLWRHVVVASCPAGARRRSGWRGAWSLTCCSSSSSWEKQMTYRTASSAGGLLVNA